MEESVKSKTGYLKLSADSLSEVMSVCKNIQLGAADLLSRCVRMVPESDKVTFKTTDGLLFLKISLAGVPNNFSDPKIFEVDSISRAAELVKDDFRFTNEENGLQMDFLGGSLDIPLYPLDPSAFDLELGEKKREAKFDKGGLIESIQLHKDIIRKAQVPELSALFLTENGFYSANGMIVSVSSETCIQAAVRYRDFSVIKSFLEWTLLKEDDMVLEVYSSVVRMVCGEDFLIVPRVKITMPQAYRGLLDNFPRTHCYFIDPRMFLSTISVLKSMPQNAGTLKMYTEGGNIYGSSVSKQGKESTFIISEQKEGLPTDFSFTMSLEVLSTALSLFATDHTMCFAVIEDSPYLFTDDKAQSIVLKRG